MSSASKGAYLNRLWEVGAAHALYRDDGSWYHRLTQFPGGLFDRGGYVVFQTEQDFLRCASLRITAHVHVLKPGISAIPGYVLAPGFLPVPSSQPSVDLDIHSSARAPTNSHSKDVGGSLPI